MQFIDLSELQTGVIIGLVVAGTLGVIDFFKHLYRRRKQKNFILEIIEDYLPQIMSPSELTILSTTAGEIGKREPVPENRFDEVRYTYFNKMTQRFELAISNNASDLDIGLKLPILNFLETIKPMTEHWKVAQKQYPPKEYYSNVVLDYLQGIQWIEPRLKVLLIDIAESG